MSLKLLTLNIEGDRHLDRVGAAMSLHLPDIACLQEVFEVDCAKLASFGSYRVTYAATTHVDAVNAFRLAPRGNWGVAVLTRVPVRTQTVVSYAADKEIRNYRKPNDPRRAVIVMEISDQERTHRIATTHFTWSPHGTATDEQREDFSRLYRVMSSYPDYVLCGDFNSPRGGEMYWKFTNDLKLIDHLPSAVQTTIDAQYHQAGALNLVVDTVFSTTGYRVSDVQVLEGLSDHKGILSTIDRDEQ